MLVSHGPIRRQPDNLYEIAVRAARKLLDERRLSDAAATGHDCE
jgi:hypothetical protein